ncbi:hypothetical protein NDU88_002018 [Pleurodeles waltl]|uniref:Secreted protein n=1 Tax=Pleurodeles waltl TaxID=8319 RepID=A0AAV7WK25_PLEWA|nr:hypothetical protein NDU88_002018 [Pleurodeles waltl]
MHGGVGAVVDLCVVVGLRQGLVTEEDGRLKTDLCGRRWRALAAAEETTTGLGSNARTSGTLQFAEAGPSVCVRRQPCVATEVAETR